MLEGNKRRVATHKASDSIRITLGEDYEKGDGRGRGEEKR